MRQLPFLALGALAALSCAGPSLRLTRHLPPEGSLGTARTMSLEVSTAVGRTVQNAVVDGLVLGELPLPVPADGVVRQQFQRRLEGLGYAVCPRTPCGDGVLRLTLLESAVNPEATRGGMKANVRLRARTVLTQTDGQTPYDWTFWANRHGPLEQAPLLLNDAADGMATEMERSLLPRTVTVTLPVEDGGPLEQGVNLLLSGQLDAATAFFTRLTGEQPGLAAAWYDLGLCAEARGDWAQAVTAYQRAAGLDRKALYAEALEAARAAVP